MIKPFHIFAAAALFVATHVLPTNTLAQVPPDALELAAYSGLHAAAAKGNVDEIKKLVAAGAKVDVRDGAGRTPLHVAAYASHETAFKSLVDGGADINAMENSAYDVITIASVANDIEILTLALTLGGNPGNITSPYDGTALIAAAHLGHAEVVGILIDAGAPLDHVNNLGWTALIESVVLGDGGPRHVDTARRLINAGANKNIADRQGVTPLNHARQRNFGEMVGLFNN